MQLPHRPHAAQVESDRLLTGRPPHARREDRLRRPRTAARATKDDKDDEGPLDFGALQQRAESLRRAEAERALRKALGQPGSAGLEGGERGPGAGEQREAREQEPLANAPGRGVFGDETAAGRDAVLQEVGPGGFDAEDFEVNPRQLGRLSFVTETAAEDPLRLRRDAEEQTAVIAYLARYNSGMPFQEPVTVLLKEYLPGAVAVACNELRALKRLLGPLPDREHKWQAARAPAADGAPIIPLLGYFTAAQSEAGSSEAPAAPGSSSSSSRSDDEEALWLVFKYERLQPLSYYAAAEQLRPGAGLFWSAESAAAEALKWRCQMLRAICRGALGALAYCHGRGVAHGSLGPGSLLLSTFEDRRAAELTVKLDNFGFGRMQQPGAAAVEGTTLYPGPAALEPGHPLALSMAEDARALGLALLDCVFAALSPEGYAGGRGGAPPGAAAGGGARPSESLQRLVTEVFAGDVQRFRKYCRQGTDYTEACHFLDELDGAGWQLLEGLLSGKAAAADLLQHNEFCRGS